MKAVTETKQGYKKTKLGWIPEDWNILNLSEILEKTSLGGNYANSEIPTEHPLIKMGNIGRGNIALEKLEYISSEGTINEDDLLKKGDVLFNTRNTLDLVGKVAIWNEELPLAYYNSNLLKLQFKSEYVSSNFFMNYNLNSYNSIKQLRAIATGTTSVAAIYTRDLLKLKIPLPPLPEQQKIAKILSTWDKAIEQSQNLIEQLKSRKKGLMQQLLTGKTRLKGFSGDWKEVKLGEVFEEIIQKNDGGKHEPLTISAKLGFVSQRAKFDRVIAGGSLDKYIQLRKNDFSYNKGNSKTYQMGCIYLLEEYESAVVPFVYISFRAINSNVSKYFYKHWFANHGLDRQLKAIITSGARGDGLLNVSKKDFFSLKIPLPDIEEQQAIAKVLTTADNEIKVQETYLQQLQAQKKGLMQQLLTGQKRVKVV